MGMTEHRVVRVQTIDPHPPKIKNANLAARGVWYINVFGLFTDLSMIWLLVKKLYTVRMLTAIMKTA
jgi:hypothetical protein